MRIRLRRGSFFLDSILFIGLLLGGLSPCRSDQSSQVFTIDGTPVEIIDVSRRTVLDLDDPDILDTAPPPSSPRPTPQPPKNVVIEPKEDIRDHQEVLSDDVSDERWPESVAWVVIVILTGCVVSLVTKGLVETASHHEN